HRAMADALSGHPQPLSWQALLGGSALNDLAGKYTFVLVQPKLDFGALQPGPFPPVVLKSDASSLPVCLVTMNGDGMTDGALKDVAQNFVRNQLASMPGASIPQPFGGPWRQIQFYVDPLKLEARQISPMDVVRSLNQANVILPAGDVKIGNLDYNIYSNAQFNSKDAGQYPVKMNGENPVLMS